MSIPCSYVSILSAESSCRCSLGVRYENMSICSSTDRMNACAPPQQGTKPELRLVGAVQQGGAVSGLGDHRALLVPEVAAHTRARFLIGSRPRAG
eukprot:2156094-Prymnesium_polylepis.1